jgi:hypothetical protein
MKARMLIDGNEDERHNRSELAHGFRGAIRIPRETSVVDACRRVVSEGFGRHRGVIIDAFSASAIVQVYDALGETNKAKYAGMNDVRKMADIAFRLMEKTREGA